MSWAYPNILFALWLVPVFGFVLWAGHIGRQKSLSAFVDSVMASKLAPERTAARFWLKTALRTCALTLLILTIARPQFGVEEQQVEASGIDVFILLDVSRSMLAEDVKPNRLERARSDILDLLRELEGDSVGLITFAGAPVVQVPLTTDTGFFRTVLQSVDTDSAPRGGTLIGDAIRKALDSMEQAAGRSQVLVLITDGEDQESFPLEAAQAAAERDVRMITIGLGDDGEGARIPERSKDGSPGFIQHEGQEVWSRMDGQLLEQIARTTSGVWIPAQTKAYDLAAIYRAQRTGLTTSSESTTVLQRKTDRFQWFLGPALVLVFVDVLISPFRNRPLGHEEASPT